MYRSSSFLGSGSSSALSASIWLIASVVLSIVGGILIYFLFLSKKNEGKYTGFLGWLYDFLSFKKMFLETLLKITYIIAALYVTLSSLALIGTNFLAFLLYLVIGNLVVRIAYEFSLILLVICRNTTEINKHFTCVEEKKEVKKETKKADKE